MQPQQFDETESTVKPSFLVHENPEVRSAATFATLSRLLAAAVSTLDVDQESARRMLTRAVALLESGDPLGRRRRGGLAPWQAQRVVRLIEDGLGRSLTVEEMADAVRLSRSHFSRAFKMTFGVAPQHYIAGRRIERAQELMARGGETLSHIAVACGFCDQAHLSRVFRQITGQSPKNWWRLHDESAMPSEALRASAAA